MTMSIGQGLITIAMVALATFLVRAFPFLLFPDNRPTPKVVLYLGKVLPFAVIGLLVVYCFKNTSLQAPNYGLRELAAIVVVVALYVWKRKSLIAIAAGTIVYMLLTQLLT
ncbi:AzlD domain-containing protein [Christensenellaceae bacterium OttesenSCG-928-L17]|nr:AzlD domain-containing protein [Christensenellaceae bacterium OttesenSCG-928-L17]